MPFTVEDFEDLLRLLYERPEWRERLRQLILPPELFELPRIAQELAEANRAARERIASLEAEQQATRQELRAGFKDTGLRIDRVEGRLQGVEGRLEHVEGDLAAFRTEVAAQFSQVDERFNQVDAQFAQVDERFNQVDAQFAQVGERFNQVDAQFAQVGERFNQVDAQFAQVDERFNQADARFDRLEDRVGHIDARTRRTNVDLGVLKGNTMEDRYRGRARTYFSALVPNPVALSVAEFDAFAEEQVSTGRLLPAEARRLGRADLLVRGGAAEHPKYLIVEVSWALDEEDVFRAADRAALLRKAGHDAQGVVAGWRIQPSALAEAERMGVGRVIERELDGLDPTGGEDDEA